MAKNNILVDILTTLSITGIALSLVKCTIDKREAGLKEVEEFSNVMLTNSNNTKIIKHKINNDPITIVLGNLDEKSKEIIKNAIYELDEISTNINYKILERDDITIMQKIKITSKPNLMEQQQIAGIASFTYDNVTGYMQYPISIVVDSDCADIHSTIDGTNYLSTVIKHEMLHTLGFKDIYNRQEKYNSIMYYSAANDDRALDYTEQDEYYIKKIYDNYVEQVNYPTTLKIEYIENKEENELLM